MRYCTQTGAATCRTASALRRRSSQDGGVLKEKPVCAEFVQREGDGEQSTPTPPHPGAQRSQPYPAPPPRGLDANFVRWAPAIILPEALQEKEGRPVGRLQGL
ncbi:uncharacterized protein [Saccopteryx bilineata]|uniref:uncharacterized protein n=1 Tax=Saccopteryx bilineata TaxID=59482 RepID=UPI00338FC66A